MIWFILINLFVIVIFLALYLVFKKSDRKLSKIDDYLGKVNSTVTSVRYGNLSTKIEKLELSDFKHLSESINRMVETLNDREKMIVEYQSELTRQNKFLEAIINSLSDGILIIDEHYKILRATPKILHWFGKESKDIISKSLLDFIQAKTDTKCDEFKEEEIFIKSDLKSSFEATTMKLALDEKKNRFVVIIKDITSLKEVEKLREDFVATLTHDLKVPIVAESNILEFLINGKFGELNEKQHEALVNMNHCNKELLELVQILLETYKINGAGIELEKQELSITDFVKSVVEDMQPIAQKAGLKISLLNQPDVKYFADELQLKRVLKNLIQNAISHSESKKDVEVKVEKEEEFINIKITDFGKGIPPEDLEKIFDKYYSTAKKFRKIGTGLGLYLSQQIIKSHGGEITVNSKENVSTEFCIKLPV